MAASATTAGVTNFDCHETVAAAAVTGRSPAREAIVAPVAISTSTAVSANALMSKSDWFMGYLRASDLAHRYCVWRCTIVESSTPGAARHHPPADTPEGAASVRHACTVAEHLLYLSVGAIRLHPT